MHILSSGEGGLEIAKMLIERKANKYRLTKTGLTAEQVYKTYLTD
jgi:hypothetical protein